MIKVVRGGASEQEAAPRQREFVALGPSDFTRVSYVEWGPPRAERTVICLHGLTRNGRDFDYLARRLVRDGIRVVAPDLPGRGRSAPMRNWHEYATPLYLSVLTSLIARLDVDEVDWVGTSLGGHIGMEFAAHAGAPIRRLVLNDFGARIAARALQRISTYLTADAGRRFASVEEIDEHLREILAPFGDLTDEQWRHLAEHGAMPTEDGRFRLRHDPAIAKQFWWPIMIDIVLWQVWDKVECPTLILRGVHSDLLSLQTVELMTRRGAAARRGLVRNVEVPACGHAPALMEDSQTDIVAEFLLADDAAVGKGARARRAGRPAMKKNKVVSAAAAVALIHDGDTVACSGFVGCGTPEELIAAIEQRFVDSNAPRDLTLMFAAAPGDGKDGGLNRLAREGLVRRTIGGHYGLVPKLAQLAVDGEDRRLQPAAGHDHAAVSRHRRASRRHADQGRARHLRRSAPGRRQVEPRAPPRTSCALMEIDGEEWLFFKALPINVALIRGTTADAAGNITMEREALTLDSLALATAARNSGGLVIAQVERVCARRRAQSARRSWCRACSSTAWSSRSRRTTARPTGRPTTRRSPASSACRSTHTAPMPLDERKVIARRCAFELPMGGVVNLGIGVPEGVARVAAEERVLNYLSLTVEAGRDRRRTAGRASTSARRSTPTR